MTMAVIDQPEIVDKPAPIFRLYPNMLKILNIQEAYDIRKLLENEFNGRWIFYI